MKIKATYGKNSKIFKCLLDEKNLFLEFPTKARILSTILSPEETQLLKQGQEITRMGSFKYKMVQP